MCPQGNDSGHLWSSALGRSEGASTVTPLEPQNKAPCSPDAEEGSDLRSHRPRSLTWTGMRVNEILERRRVQLSSGPEGDKPLPLDGKAMEEQNGASPSMVTIMRGWPETHSAWVLKFSWPGLPTHKAWGHAGPEVGPDSPACGGKPGQAGGDWHVLELLPLLCHPSPLSLPSSPAFDWKPQMFCTH